MNYAVSDMHFYDIFQMGLSTSGYKILQEVPYYEIVDVMNSRYSYHSFTKYNGSIKSF